jgi:uncharacterized surface protein with fasciclin (FAS1) repeats
LTKVLTRHVIAAKVLSTDIKNGPVKTLGGEIIYANVEESESGTKVTKFLFGHIPWKMSFKGYFEAIL